MEENSKKDTLSRKAFFSKFSQKTPIVYHLCNKKLKSKSGYTLHLKKCSQNLHISQKNEDETIFLTTTAPPLPTFLPTIVSPSSITPADSMNTSATALTTVTTASTTSSTPTIVNEVDTPPHDIGKVSDFSNDSFPSLSHASAMTVPINIPKNH